jgi:hypothetical protein
LKTTHICPPFCHRCPNIGMAIRGFVGCQLLTNELSHCLCVGSRCACGKRPEARCTWPIEAMAHVTVGELEPGDVCSNLSNSRTGRVITIEPTQSVFNTNLLRLTVGRFTKQSGLRYSQFDDYQWDKSAMVLARRPGICGEPACERHIRDLVGGFICSGHWGAQLDAIA